MDDNLLVDIIDVLGELRTSLAQLVATHTHSSTSVSRKSISDDIGRLSVSENSSNVSSCASSPLAAGTSAVLDSFSPTTTRSRHVSSSDVVSCASMVSTLAGETEAKMTCIREAMGALTAQSIMSSTPHVGGDRTNGSRRSSGSTGVSCGGVEYNDTTHNSNSVNKSNNDNNSSADHNNSSNSGASHSGVVVGRSGSCGSPLCASAAVIALLTRKLGDVLGSARGIRVALDAHGALCDVPTHRSLGSSEDAESNPSRSGSVMSVMSFNASNGNSASMNNSNKYGDGNIHRSPMNSPTRGSGTSSSQLTTGSNGGSVACARPPLWPSVVLAEQRREALARVMQALRLMSQNLEDAQRLLRIAYPDLFFRKSMGATSVHRAAALQQQPPLPSHSVSSLTLTEFPQSHSCAGHPELTKQESKEANTSSSADTDALFSLAIARTTAKTDDTIAPNHASEPSCAHLTDTPAQTEQDTLTHPLASPSTHDSSLSVQQSPSTAASSSSAASPSPSRVCRSNGGSADSTQNISHDEGVLHTSLQCWQWAAQPSQHITRTMREGRKRRLYVDSFSREDDVRRKGSSCDDAMHDTGGIRGTSHSRSSDSHSHDTQSAGPESRPSSRHATSASEDDEAIVCGSTDERGFTPLSLTSTAPYRRTDTARSLDMLDLSGTRTTTTAIVDSLPRSVKATPIGVRLHPIDTASSALLHAPVIKVTTLLDGTVDREAAATTSLTRPVATEEAQPAMCNSRNARVCMNAATHSVPTSSSSPTLLTRSEGVEERGEAATNTAAGVVDVSISCISSNHSSSDSSVTCGENAEQRLQKWNDEMRSGTMQCSTSNSSHLNHYSLCTLDSSTNEASDPIGDHIMQYIDYNMQSVAEGAVKGAVSELVKCTAGMTEMGCHEGIDDNDSDGDRRNRVYIKLIDAKSSNSSTRSRSRDAVTAMQRRKLNVIARTTPEELPASEGATDLCSCVSNVSATTMTTNTTTRSTVHSAAAAAEAIRQEAPLSARSSSSGVPQLTDAVPAMREVSEQGGSFLYKQILRRSCEQQKSMPVHSVAAPTTRTAADGANDIESLGSSGRSRHPRMQDSKDETPALAGAVASEESPCSSVAIDGTAPGQEGSEDALAADRSDSQSAHCAASHRSSSANNDNSNGDNRDRSSKCTTCNEDGEDDPCSNTSCISSSAHATLMKASSGDFLVGKARACVRPTKEERNVEEVCGKPPRVPQLVVAHVTASSALSSPSMLLSYPVISTTATATRMKNRDEKERQEKSAELSQNVSQTTARGAVTKHMHSFSGSEWHTFAEQHGTLFRHTFARDVMDLLNYGHNDEEPGRMTALVDIHDVRLSLLKKSGVYVFYALHHPVSLSEHEINLRVSLCAFPALDEVRSQLIAHTDAEHTAPAMADRKHDGNAAKVNGTRALHITPMTSQARRTTNESMHLIDRVMSAPTLALSQSSCQKEHENEHEGERKKAHMVGTLLSIATSNTCVASPNAEMACVASSISNRAETAGRPLDAEHQPSHNERHRAHARSHGVRATLTNMAHDVQARDSARARRSTLHTEQSRPSAILRDDMDDANNKIECDSGDGDAAKLCVIAQLREQDGDAADITCSSPKHMDDKVTRCIHRTHGIDETSPITHNGTEYSAHPSGTLHADDDDDDDGAEEEAMPRPCRPPCPLPWRRDTPFSSPWTTSNTPTTTESVSMTLATQRDTQPRRTELTKKSNLAKVSAGQAASAGNTHIDEVGWGKDAVQHMRPGRGSSTLADSLTLRRAVTSGATAERSRKSVSLLATTSELTSKKDTRCVGHHTSSPAHAGWPVAPPPPRSAMAHSALHTVRHRRDLHPANTYKDPSEGPLGAKERDAQDEGSTAPVRGRRGLGDGNGSSSSSSSSSASRPVVRRSHSLSDCHSLEHVRSDAVRGDPHPRPPRASVAPSCRQNRAVSRSRMRTAKHNDSARPQDSSNRHSTNGNSFELNEQEDDDGGKPYKDDVCASLPKATPYRTASVCGTRDLCNSAPKSTSMRHSHQFSSRNSAETAPVGRLPRERKELHSMRRDTTTATTKAVPRMRQQRKKTRSSHDTDGATNAEEDEDGSSTTLHSSVCVSHVGCNDADVVQQAVAQSFGLYIQPNLVVGYVTGLSREAGIMPADALRKVDQHSIRSAVDLLRYLTECTVHHHAHVDHSSSSSSIAATADTTTTDTQTSMRAAPTGGLPLSRPRQRRGSVLITLQSSRGTVLTRRLYLPKPDHCHHLFLTLPVATSFGDVNERGMVSSAGVGK